MSESFAGSGIPVARGRFASIRRSIRLSRLPGAPRWGKWLLPVAAALVCSSLALAGELTGLSGWSEQAQTLWRWASLLYAGLTIIHAAIAACMLFAGVAAAGLAAGGVIGIELGHKAVLASVLAAPLAFAQTTGTGRTQPEPANVTKTQTAHPEIQFGLYGGGNMVSPADVVLKQPNGTDMTLKNVRWWGDSFDDPPFYGLRWTYWPAPASSLGVMIDFTHAKAFARRNKTVSQKGTRDGEPVPPRERVSATFDKLEYSHGLNFLTLNAVFRFRGLHRRIVPYFGAGIGVMLPHTEIGRTARPRKEWTYRYELSGLGFQGLAGIESRFKPAGRVKPFAEFKLGYARNNTLLNKGGSVRTNLLAQQTIVGLSIYNTPPLAKPGAK